ncbi:type II toxin-antitoxin system RelE/ParE family toxin [Patescibacteria group bacterium]|nr:type II toxin-antitoxin system RelE/ParE family toxin [Patescibacteria group bacterium]MBU1896048.1 type II toxin-antitoxin system RelE/ParE family toxin [Patescibacteria group bacterium]
MDKIEKLLRKISKKQREFLLGVIKKLLSGKNEGLDIKKLKDTDFYRLRSGRFRIIFHKENNEIIIDGIKLRDENTYK